MRKLPDVLTMDEQKKLLAVFNTRYLSGRKNRLIVELMLTAGLRVSEICNLKWRDIRWKGNKLLIKQGKREVDRNLFIPDSLRDALHAFMKENDPISAYVFGTRSGLPVDRSNLNKMVKQYADKAGIEKNVYNHLLRHTALTDIYTDTKDIRKVQQIAGHASIQTTQIYTHISAEEVRETMTKEKY